MKTRSTTTRRSVALLAACMVFAAACSSDDATESAETTTAAAAEPVAETAAEPVAETAAETTAEPVAETAAEPAASPLDEAKARLEPFSGKPSPWPVNNKLNEPVPAGTTLAFLTPDSPVAAIFWTIFEGAAQVAGVKPVRVDTKLDPATLNASIDTVLSSKPNALILPAIPFPLFSARIPELTEANIPIVSGGSSSTKAAGITYDAFGADEILRDGALMADYVAVNFGEDSNIVFYQVPAIDFNIAMNESFAAQIKEVCPGCTVRTVDITGEEMVGGLGPDRIVSDLQANPDTSVAVFATDEVIIGLKQKLDTAGVEGIKTLAFGPLPSTLQAVKDGDIDAVYTFDFPALVFQMTDMALKAVNGQALEGEDAKGYMVTTFLTQKDINFDVSQGWLGYPDFAPRFMELWGTGG